MKSSALWRVSVTTSPHAEDAVAELLESLFGQLPSSYTNADSQEVTVSVYLPAKRQRLFPGRREVAMGLQRMVRAGIPIGLGRVSLARMPREDWAESWKRHFQPLVLGPALLVRPSWSRRAPQKGQAVVVLDPGLSFGTGHHPTTAFCLRQLVARRRRRETQSCLDVGSGSGVLAIAAAKLGYHPVDALDCAPEAVRIARRNARGNSVSAAIRFLRQDFTKLPRRSERKYSVVCANLLSNLLIAERERLLARLQPNGVLVAAGILKSEFGKVQETFESAGMRLAASRTQNEWRSGTFAWP